MRCFKGLERPVVILTAIDDLTAVEETGLLFFGTSRARVHLVVVVRAETMGRLSIAE